MSERDPRVEEYLESFGPKEMAEAILLIAFEQNESSKQLDKNDYELFMDKKFFLNEELEKEDPDLKIVRGVSMELKTFLINKLNVPVENFTHQNLIQFRQARHAEIRKEHGVKEEFDPFAEPKKKEYKN